MVCLLFVTFKVVFAHVLQRELHIGHICRPLPNEFHLFATIALPYLDMFLGELSLVLSQSGLALAIFQEKPGQRMALRVLVLAGRFAKARDELQRGWISPQLRR